MYYIMAFTDTRFELKTAGFTRHASEALLHVASLEYCSFKQDYTTCRGLFLPTQRHLCCYKQFRLLKSKIGSAKKSTWLLLYAYLHHLETWTAFRVQLCLENETTIINTCKVEYEPRKYKHQPIAEGWLQRQMGLIPFSSPLLRAGSSVKWV
jgi:hypothetical protein